MTASKTPVFRDKNQGLNDFLIAFFIFKKAPKKKTGRVIHYLFYRISKGGRYLRVTTGYEVNPDQWDKNKKQVNSKHPDQNRINSALSEKIAEVKKAIARHDLDGKALTLEDVKRLFGRGDDQRSNDGKVISFMKELIDEMKAVKKTGNARAYTYVMNALLKYTKGKDISFDRFDYTFLKKYSTHLEAKNMKDTSLSIHFRTLRAVVNEAIRRKLTSREAYPFETFKVSKYSVATRPRAISEAEMKAIERLQLSPVSFLYDARNYFLFSYYGCGLNFVDLSQLRWQDIEGDLIRYTRQKTGALITIKILPYMSGILSYYEAFTGSAPANYVFPILDRRTHITHNQIENRIEKVEKRVNKALREISTLAGLIKPVTFYVARHTFATTLHRNGIPVSQIAALLGHDERVTKVYLKRLDDADKFKGLEVL